MKNNNNNKMYIFISLVLYMYCIYHVHSYAATRSSSCHGNGEFFFRFVRYSGHTSRIVCAGRVGTSRYDFDTFKILFHPIYVHSINIEYENNINFPLLMECDPIITIIVYRLLYKKIYFKNYAINTI